MRTQSRRSKEGATNPATPAPASSPKVFHGSIFPVSVFTRETFAALSPLAAGDRVNRSPVRRPADHVVVRFKSRDRMNAAAFQRPDSPFSIGPTHRHALAVGRELHADNAFRSDGLGIAIAQINQVIASAMSGFNPDGQQPLAVSAASELRCSSWHRASVAVPRPLPLAPGSAGRPSRVS